MGGGAEIELSGAEAANCSSFGSGFASLTGAGAMAAVTNDSRLSVNIFAALR